MNSQKVIFDLQEKKFMLTNAQQFIEDRESMASMINVMISGQEKEAALYAQKMENMRQVHNLLGLMISCELYYFECR